MFHRLEKWKGKSPKSHLPRPKPSRAVTACGESKIVCFCASLQTARDGTTIVAPAWDGHCLVLFRFQQFLHPQSTGFSCFGKHELQQNSIGFKGFGWLWRIRKHAHITGWKCKYAARRVNQGHDSQQYQTALSCQSQLWTSRNTKRYSTVIRFKYIHSNKEQINSKTPAIPHDLDHFGGPPMRKKRKAPKLSNGCKVAEENPMDKGVVSCRFEALKVASVRDSSIRSNLGILGVSSSSNCIIGYIYSKYLPFNILESRHIPNFELIMTINNTSTKNHSNNNNQ